MFAAILSNVFWKKLPIFQVGVKSNIPFALDSASHSFALFVISS